MKTDLKTFTPNTKELPAAPTLPFVVRSDIRGYLSRLGLLRPIIALILMAVLVIRNLQYGLIISGLVVVTIVIVFLAVRQRKMTLNTDEIIYRGAFGQKRIALYSDIKEAHVFVNFADAGFGLTPRIILERVNGERFVSINLLYWSPEGVDAMLSTLRQKKIKTTYYGDVVSSGMLANHFPRLLSYAEKHPYIVASLIVLGIVVAVSVFVLITMPR